MTTKTDEHGIRQDATAHAAGCTCGHRSDAMTRDAMLAEIRLDQHPHVDWPSKSDNYVRSYLDELRRRRERSAAVATVPLGQPTRQPEMRADAKDGPPEFRYADSPRARALHHDSSDRPSGFDPEKAFANEADEGRAERLAMQRTPLGEKPDATAMRKARLQVQKENGPRAESGALINGISETIATIRKRGGGQ